MYVISQINVFPISNVQICAVHVVRHVHGRCSSRGRSRLGARRRCHRAFDQEDSSQGDAIYLTGDEFKFLSIELNLDTFESKFTARAL